jgi:hypothetical protein
VNPRSIFEYGDTVVVSRRNSISDVTFYDSANLVTRIDQTGPPGFPVQFIEKNRIHESETKAMLIKQLKEGKDLPVRPFHDDWIIIIILISAFLFSSARAFSNRLFPDFTKFFLFRGVGDPALRDTGELFHWQSTVINLISFFIGALFAWCAASYYDLIPHGISGIVYWLIAFAVIVVVVTLRHILCFATGSLSSEKEAFSEYILIIYQSYRYLAFILFILVILLSYTHLFPPKYLLLTGIISMGALYLVRMIRLFLIFMKRNISILYLILYLCALEFLPVIITLKYFTGYI